MDLDQLRSAVDWRDGRLELVDQTQLPERLVVLRPTTVAEVVDALSRLAVRGAPAIGVAGAFGVVLGLAEAGRAELGSRHRLLTHCNTGRLATAGLGTALGVVYAKAAAGDPVRVLASETRPLLQGARLTAWELVTAGIPVTVVADTAAGAAMAGGLVDAVLVGCDRVAANGDTANKVGTYSLAVLAAANRIPFYVVGPLSSFDPEAADGAHIEIEQRPAAEVSTLAGARVAPEAAAVWNPAFDVTPAALITAFVTDAGVLRPPFQPAIAAALTR
ncbi:MAG TPA: s-methyl-5-thioribose-1-phosphate isomerase [Actinomycetes bacterium]